MCSLPKGWEVKTLGEVCEVLDKLRKPITKRNRIEGAYPYYGATGILSYVHKYIFDEKLVLIGEDGAKWLSGDNTSFIVKGKYWVNNHAHVIRPNRSEVLDEWIVYFLNFSNLSKYVTGLTVPKLNQEKMKSITIPIPPLTEQKQIVKKLDTCFAEINQAKTNLEQNTQNTKDLFQSTLTQIFTNPNNDWEVKTLGEVCTETFNLKWQDHENKTFEYIDLSAVSRKYLSVTKTVQIDITNAPSRAKKIIQTGDIIFATTRPTLKRISVVSEQFNNQICSTGFVVLRAKNNLIKHKLIFYFLQTDAFINEMESTQRGTSYPAVSDNDVKNIKISTPPLSEQKQIVKKLNQLNQQTQTLDRNYQNQLKSLTELKQSLLEKAFNGDMIT